MECICQYDKECKILFNCECLWQIWINLTLKTLNVTDKMKQGGKIKGEVINGGDLSLFCQILKIWNGSAFLSHLGY